MVGMALELNRAHVLGACRLSATVDQDLGAGKLRHALQEAAGSMDTMLQQRLESEAALISCGG